MSASISDCGIKGPPFFLLVPIIPEIRQKSEFSNVIKRLRSSGPQDTACLEEGNIIGYLLALSVKCPLSPCYVLFLYQILKDADALDRVRFGIYALDVNQLRLHISHKLAPLAVAAVTGIKM